VRGFGELEAQVMDRLWAAEGPCTVREVHTELAETRSLAYTTVLTVMDKLHRKGWLEREPVGRAYAYMPTRTRDQYTADLMGEALQASSDPSATLVAFVEALNPEDAAALRIAFEGAAAEPPDTTSRQESGRRRGRK
jgi:predicted transcriptional regulator